MLRSVVNLMHDIRVFGAHGVFRGVIRYPIRQKLVHATTGTEAGCLCCAVSPAYAHQPFTGQLSSLEITHFTHVD